MISQRTSVEVACLNFIRYYVVINFDVTFSIPFDLSQGISYRKFYLTIKYSLILLHIPVVNTIDAYFKIRSNKSAVLKLRFR